MKEKHEKKTIANDIITGIDRAPLISNGIDIGNFDTIKFLPKIYEKLNEKIQYLIWNNGKPKLNKEGGYDIIALLFLGKDGIVYGWTR